MEKVTAKFGSNGTHQRYVLQNRSAYLRCWRTWNKGKIVSASHER
jgi:hypothetical protein